MLNTINTGNLLNRFKYEIILKPEVTILTGPNGYGKSTILRCIEALSKGNIFYFWQLNFQKIHISFDKPKYEIIIEKNKQLLIINKIKFTKIPPEEYVHIKNRFIVKMDDNRWLDRKTGKIMYEDEYYSKLLFIDDENINKEQMIILKEIKKAIGLIYFIKEQRLIKEERNRRDEATIINVIEELSNKFQNLIKNISSDYSSISNKLDSTYPNRLFNTEIGINESEYNEKMGEMTNKFEKLNKYDISAMQHKVDVFFKKEHAKALKIYFEDFNIKYEVYENFVHQLDLFTDIINNRLSFKQIKISRENGIIILDNNKNPLKLKQLSSGEKQEIVLFYELIFETPNNALLLIDEPEISLHIVWQKMFMDDLLKIVKYKKIKVIVATHSPQIINNHWDIQIDLGELYGNELN